MPETKELKENKSSESSVKWIIGIVLAGVLLAGGGYLIYRFWFKKPPEQVQQEQGKKDELRRQIKLIKEKIAYSKAALEAKKAGQEHEFDPFDEPFEEINFSSLDQEAEELLKEKSKVWNEYELLLNEIEKNVALQQNQKTKNENDEYLATWNKQKNGNWRILTERLDKSPEVKTKFNQFITHFYHRYKELKKDIPTHPAANLKGFGHFYVDGAGEAGKVTEMGHTKLLDGESKLSKMPNETKWTIVNYPSQININQLYLLNNGKNPGGRMDKFFYKEPKFIPGGTLEYLEISFDKLIQTIAHEIAHAFQTAKNISEDKTFTNTEGKPEFDDKISDCWESGEGEWDHKEHKLKIPKYPELVKEHKQFEIEIEQMIKKDPFFQRFKTWWEANN